MEVRTKGKIIYDIITTAFLEIPAVVLYSLAFSYPSEKYKWICIITTLVTSAIIFFPKCLSVSGLIGLWVESCIVGYIISLVFRADFRLIGFIIISIIILALVVSEIISLIRYKE